MTQTVSRYFMIFPSGKEAVCCTVLGHLSKLIFYILYDLTHRISSRYCLYFKNLLIFQVDSMIRVSSGMCKVEMACVLYDHTSQGARDFSRKTGECIGKR